MKKETNRRPSMPESMLNSEEPLYYEQEAPYEKYCDFSSPDECGALNPETKECEYVGARSKCGFYYKNRKSRSKSAAFWAGKDLVEIFNCDIRPCIDSDYVMGGEQ